MKEITREYGSILLCGGKGTRLMSQVEEAPPKSLLKVNGKELILYSVDTLNSTIVKDIVLAVDFRAELIKEWAEIREWDQQISFSEQDLPGVLSAIDSASAITQKDQIIACNTDEIRLTINLEEIVRFHEKQKTLATMVTTHSDNLHRHRVITLNPSKGIAAKTELKPERYLSHPEKIGLINTGFLLLEKRAVEYFDRSHNKDWGGVIDPLCDMGQLSIYTGEIKYFNVGTPEELEEAEIFLSQNPG